MTRPYARRAHGECATVRNSGRVFSTPALVEQRSGALDGSGISVPLHVAVEISDLDKREAFAALLEPDTIEIHVPSRTCSAVFDRHSASVPSGRLTYSNDAAMKLRDPWHGFAMNGENPIPAPKIRTVSRESALAGDPLAAFHVFWFDITEADLVAYQEELDAASDERPMQAHLTEHPILLAQTLDGGHGRWILPHKDLGGRFEPDFVLGHRWSGPTWEWVLVELQTPVLSGSRNRDGHLFMKNGRMSEQLDEGLRQINEWRRWISMNLDVAKRPRDEMGLGLTGIDPSPPGLLIIGREDDLTPEHAAMRKQLAAQHNVQIHSYDWLAREARSRILDLNDASKSPGQ